MGIDWDEVWWIKHPVWFDYFPTLSVSSAKAESGFSVLKSLKPSKQAVLTNPHLQWQMLVNIDEPEIESFKPHKSIDY